MMMDGMRGWLDGYSQPAGELQDVAPLWSLLSSKPADQQSCCNLPISDNVDLSVCGIRVKSNVAKIQHSLTLCVSYSKRLPLMVVAVPGLEVGQQAWERCLAAVLVLGLPQHMQTGPEGLSDSQLQPHGSLQESVIQQHRKHP